MEANQPPVEDVLATITRDIDSDWNFHGDQEEWFSGFDENWPDVDDIARQLVDYFLFDLADAYYEYEDLEVELVSDITVERKESEFGETYYRVMFTVRVGDYDYMVIIDQYKNRVKIYARNL